jgi:hypothetical protein
VVHVRMRERVQAFKTNTSRTFSPFRLFHAEPRFLGGISADLRGCIRAQAKLAGADMQLVVVVPPLDVLCARRLSARVAPVTPAKAESAVGRQQGVLGARHWAAYRLRGRAHGAPNSIGAGKDAPWDAA